MPDRSAAAIANADEKPFVPQTPDQQLAQEKRDAAAKRSDAARSGQVEALLRERQGYVVRDLPDRVAAVDASLSALGHKADVDTPKPRARARKTEV